MIKYLQQITLATLGLLWIVVSVIGSFVGVTYTLLQLLPSEMWYVVGPLILFLYLPMHAWLVYLAIREYFSTHTKVNYD